MPTHRAGDPAAGEYVSAVGPGWVEVVSVNEAHRHLFADHGGTRTGFGTVWRFGYAGDDELRVLLGAFHEAGITLVDVGDPSPRHEWARLAVGG